MTAFGESYEQVYPSDLEKLGREIVKRCANLPLAIRVVGSLLYDQGKEKWQLFKKIGLGRLKEGENGGIEPILKLSFHCLEPPLKTCFAYCALFPKDHVIEKDMINLWMAQDYIVPLQGQSIEDAGEEYFSILMKRCFFQDLRKDEYSNIVSCKIHDLMHDIAQEVAGSEIYATDYFMTNLDKKVRHLSYFSMDEGKQSTFSRTKIRTCLSFHHWTEQCPFVGTLLTNWTCLRALDLSKSAIKCLPSASGKLLHLRYLDLSENDELEMLPNSITKLQNLQILRLQKCSRLKELPKDLPELVKLRVLDIGHCRMLSGMPRGMGKLRCLHKLPMFIAGDGNSTSKQCVVDRMKDLKALTDLKGCLDINILRNSEYTEGYIREGGYIMNKEHLHYVSIDFPVDYTMVDYEEVLLLEHLQPHYNLRELKLGFYNSMRMPSWAREDNLTTFLPNLVKVELHYCDRLQHLPSLGKLQHLKSLTVRDMLDLEYIENTTNKVIISNDAGASKSETLFPSLEQLKLSCLPKLNGWWRDDEIVDCESKEGAPLLPSFPCLSKLTIWECPHLTCMPWCPTIEELDLYGKLNENLRIINITESGNSKLRSVRVPNARHLISALPFEAFQCLQEMKIWKDAEMESLSEVEEVFRSCSSSLRELAIDECQNLKSLSGGLEHLTVLEKLALQRLPNLNLCKTGEREMEDEDDDGMPWCCLCHSLRALTIDHLPQMVNLPKGIRCLTALESLGILYCKELKSLPESQELTSLKILLVGGCSDGLRERCQNPTGEDWSNIRHISRHIMW